MYAKPHPSIERLCWTPTPKKLILFMEASAIDNGGYDMLLL